MLEVKLSNFPALQSENSSIRLKLNDFNEEGPIGFFYPVIINRTTGNQFFALNSKCAHEGCVVPPASPTIICPCHESTYRANGSVVAGSRATSGLTSYRSSFDGVDTLCIEVPNLGFRLTPTLVQNGLTPRIRLRFPTKSGVTYEVRFRQSLSEEGTPVLFALTEGDAASEPTLTGTGATLSLYLDRTSARGFYTVAVQVSEA
jgi:nitrite reductase/ring-hydroxylating ferredoxin subunit